MKYLKSYNESPITLVLNASNEWLTDHKLKPQEGEKKSFVAWDPKLKKYVNKEGG